MRERRQEREQTSRAKQV